MPYIKYDDRLNFDSLINNLSNRITSVGELNYVITKLCLGVIEKLGKRYKHINSIVGVLECAKLELYRRLAAPYEDTKIIQNGDVYED